MEQVDKMGLVHRIEDGKYLVDNSIVSELNSDVYEFRNETYMVGVLPGVSPKNQGQACIHFHKHGELTVPQEIIDKKAVFRVVQKDDYEHDGNIIEEVTDPKLVRSLIEHILRKYKKQEKEYEQQE